MKTLISSSRPPLFLPNPNSSPWKWKPKSPTTLLCPRASKSPNHSRRTHRAKANAKGFSGTPALSQTIKETPATKNSDEGNQKTQTRDDEEIPQVVFERMIVRIVVSVGVPMATGLALLKLFGAIRDQHLWDVPVWLPLLTTFLTFGVSTLGIAYGALSTSWDAEKKGSLLGFEETQENWVEMWREEDENNR